MGKENDYLAINKRLWNKKTEHHLKSQFYDLDGFINGDNSLKEIELQLLGDVKGKHILHLQCHFGQDTISLGRMGAKVTGIDLSDKAIEAAKSLSLKMGIPATFICCDIYDLPNHLNEKFDVVFTTYGTIGWLPDLTKWAGIVSTFLKPGGKFVFADFHPVVWMMNENFEKIQYNYFNQGAIIETESGTYAEKDAAINLESVCWNHSMSEVVNNLIKCHLQIDSIHEYNYSPYNCFNKTIEFEKGKFRIEHLGNKIPMVYSIQATKK